MKNITLLACLLVLTLGASAQTSQSVSPIAVPPIAKDTAEQHGAADC